MLLLALGLGVHAAKASDALALDTSLDLPAAVPGPSLRPPATVDWAQQGLPENAIPPPQPTADGGWLSGMASVYSQRLQGRPTASGEPYHGQGWTAAHRDLPLGTLLSVRNPASGAEVVVRVNDRGPFHTDRLVDLSMAAAQALGLLRQGVALVVIRPLSADEAERRVLGPQLADGQRQPSGIGPLLAEPVGGVHAPRAHGKPRHRSTKPRHPRTKRR